MARLWFAAIMGVAMSGCDHHRRLHCARGGGRHPPPRHDPTRAFAALRGEQGGDRIAQLLQGTNDAGHVESTTSIFASCCESCDVKLLLCVLRALGTRM